MIDKYKEIQEALIAATQAQLTDLSVVHTKELGEVIDMIKDLAEAEYYCCAAAAKCLPTEKETTNEYRYTEEVRGHKPRLKPHADLEAYLQNLSQDINDMIQNASAEDKQLLQRKLNVLAEKITER